MTSRIELLDHQSRDQIRDILNSNGIAEEITRSEVREAYGDDLASGALYLAKLKIDDILIGQRMAELYLDTIRTVRAEGRQPVLGFFTGSTGETGYGTLVQRSKMEGISWADVITFNMDEYAGVDPDDAMSYIRFMREHLFNHVDIDLNNTHFPTTELWQTYDDNIASYYLSTAPFVTNLEADKTDGTSTKSTIQGPRGTKLEFSILSSVSLRTSTFLFDQIGSSATVGSPTVDFKYIDSTVRVQGATTGYRVDIPVRFIKKS